MPAKPKKAYKRPPRRNEGRPPTYDATDHPQRAYELCARAGLSNALLAQAFGVHMTTIDAWIATHPEFSRAVKKGRDDFDSAAVEVSLSRKATGFFQKVKRVWHHNGEIIEHEYEEYFPPDTAAAFIWLKNRRPDRWRDKQTFEHEAGSGMAEILGLIDGKTRGFGGDGGDDG